MNQEQRVLETEWQRFRREKEQFRKTKRMEEQRLARENELFEAKWRILEEEYVRLAREKKALEEARKRYESIRTEPQDGLVKIQGELFFSGVDSELGMKKRYKDLIKIFHPDNLNGDTSTLQKINQEYEKMKKIFCE